MAGTLRVVVLTTVLFAACGSGSSRGSADRGAEPPAPPRVAADAAAPSPAQPDSPCAADADCAAIQQDEECCDMCGWRGLTKEGLAAFRRHCAGRSPRCPAIDCPYEARHAACVQGRCVAVPGEPATDGGAASCRPATADERAAIAAAERFLWDGGVLRGSPPPPPAAPPPQAPPDKRPRGRIIFVEDLQVDREALEPHAWGVVRSAAVAGAMMVVFRYDAEWLQDIHPGDIAAEQAHAGQAVEIVPGQAPAREHQDFLLGHAEHVCPAP